MGGWLYLGRVGKGRRDAGPLRRVDNAPARSLRYTVPAPQSLSALRLTGCVDRSALAAARRFVAPGPSVPEATLVF
jgi:hypothetical protein